MNTIQLFSNHGHLMYTVSYGSDQESRNLNHMFPVRAFFPVGIPIYKVWDHTLWNDFERLPELYDIIYVI